MLDFQRARTLDGLGYACLACVPVPRKPAPPTRPGTKRCCRCKRILDVAAFGRNRSEKDGLQPRCKTCSRIAKQAHLNGLSADEYEALIAGQDRRCKICGHQPPRGLVVDHDPRTGQVRGLLCNECNTGLGFFEDSADRLKAAAAYVFRVLDGA